MVSFVKTNKDIAKLLQIKLLRQRNRRMGQISEINGWRARPDFPAYQKGNGYPAVEVLQWSERFASQIAPEKQRREAVSQILGGEKATAKAVKLLQNIEHRTSNIEHRSEGGSPGFSPHLGNDGPVPSQAAMAVELQERYGFPIKRQAIQRWIHGIHLPAGAPRFPVNDAGRAGWNNPQPCYEWYEKWVIAPLRPSANGSGQAMQMDLIGQKAADAQVAEYDKSIESAAIEKLKREALEREISSKWMLRDDARAQGTRAISDIMGIVKAEYERNAPQRRRERLAALCSDFLVSGSELETATTNPKPETRNPSALLAAFAAWDAEDERARFDRIKAACAARAGDGNSTQRREEVKAQ